MAVGLLALAGCAVPPPRAPDDAHWIGRLSVRQDTEPVRSFAAGFELRGDAGQGELLLQSPFGATLARLHWSPRAARLQAEGRDQQFDSLDALTREVLGSELPIAGIFAWLRREPADFGAWTSAFEDRDAGRLIARRLAPPPAVELRLVLE